MVLEVAVSVVVELPSEERYNGQAYDDPAIEAAITAIPEAREVYLWGWDTDPAKVTLEVHEEDVRKVEDHR